MSYAHSPIFPSLHLRHTLFSNLSVALPTSQLILQLFRCFTYVTAHSPALFRFSYVTRSSLTSHGEPPMETDSKDEDKISGHSTVQQATIAYFTEMEEGVAPMPSRS